MFYMAFPYIYICSSHTSRCFYTDFSEWVERYQIHGSAAGPRKVQCLQYATVNPHSPASRSLPCCAEVPKPKDWLIDWVLKWISLCVGFFWGCFLKGSLDDLDSNMFLLEFRGGSHCECPSVGTGRNTIDQMVNRMTARRNDLFQPTNYPMVNIQKAIEHGAIEIVDFPSKNGDFP